MKRLGIRLPLLLLSLILAACTEAPVGTASRPFSLYFVPSTDAQILATGSEHLAKSLSQSLSRKLYGKDTGFFVKAAVPNSYVAVVEAFGTKKADFAALTTFAYILAKDIKKYDVEPVVTILRGNNELTYQGAIFVPKNSPIKKVEDLNGKKFAFVDPASATGYLLPFALFKEKNISPGEVIFAQKHDSVITLVYQGRVDAGAAYFIANNQDARDRVKTQFPDVFDRVRVLMQTEPIMNEPWIVRSHLWDDEQKNVQFKQYLKESLLEYASTAEGKRTLQSLYSVNGLSPVTDQAYSRIREIVKAAGLDVEKTVPR